MDRVHKAGDCIRRGVSAVEIGYRSNGARRGGGWARGKNAGVVAKEMDNTNTELDARAGKTEGNAEDEMGRVAERLREARVGRERRTLESVCPGQTGMGKND